MMLALFSVISLGVFSAMEEKTQWRWAHLAIPIAHGRSRHREVREHHCTARCWDCS